jgi:pimeloyl-ACP methyl ester carboxylesterase
MVKPRNLEGDIIETIRRVFTDDWLAAPDDADLPTRQTPHCPRPRTLLPANSHVLPNAPLFPHFETNYQRACAEELLKKTNALGPTFSKKGFFNQMLAANGHRKTEAQLRALADAVGRERIMVLHGDRDRLIACELGERLMRALEPAVALVLEGMGHAPFVEQARPFNELMEQRFGMGEKLNCG